MSWLDYAATLTWSNYLQLYGFFVGSVAWKTTVYAGMVWCATRVGKRLWGQRVSWQPSFKDSKTWMGIVIAAMLVTFPLGGFATYHLSLEAVYWDQRSHPAPSPFANEQAKKGQFVPMSKMEICDRVRAGRKETYGDGTPITLADCKQKSSSWSWSWPELHWPEWAKSYWCWSGSPNGWHWVRAQASDKGCGGFHSTIFWWRVD